MTTILTPALLLVITTVLYAGYNVLVKASAGAIPETAQTTIHLTITLQIAALATSLVFAAVLWGRGVNTFHASQSALAWAVLAGICIGGAEIAYFYLFGGVQGHSPMSAGIAIPTVVTGTIIISMFAAALMFHEIIGWKQIAGAGLVIAGIAVMFHGRSGV